MLQVLDDDEDEEEAAPGLVHRSRRHPEVVPTPSSRPAEDPPIAQAADKQARPDRPQPTTTVGRAKRSLFHVAQSLRPVSKKLFSIVLNLRQL